MVFAGDLKWCYHRRPCFWSRKHHRRILALTSRLTGSVLHVTFWLPLIAEHRRYQCRFQWFVAVCTHSVSHSHQLAKLTRLLSGFALVLLTTSISGSIVEDTRESMFSRSCSHMLEPFFRIFSGCGSVQKTVKSSASSVTDVRVLAVRVWSTRHIILLSTSSARLWLSTTAIMTFLQLWTSLSQISTMWGVPGGLNFQTIFFCAESLLILALSHPFMSAFSSLAASTKFVPLLLMMVFG